MPLFIPIIAAAGTGAAGWWWFTSEEDEKPSFTGELFEVLKPILIVALIVLGLRWLYKQGTATKNTTKSKS